MNTPIDAALNQISNKNIMMNFTFKKLNYKKLNYMMKVQGQACGQNEWLFFKP